jgi:hypothetical protein
MEFFIGKFFFYFGFDQTILLGYLVTAYAREKNKLIIECVIIFV